MTITEAALAALAIALPAAAAATRPSRAADLAWLPGGRAATGRAAVFENPGHGFPQRVDCAAGVS